MRFVVALAMAFGLAAAPALAEIGDDGLHKEPWFEITFKDVRDDMALAAEQGKRLALIFEQRGCIYCKELHEEVLSDPGIAEYISDNFVVVQYNLWGDEAVVDLDGEEMAEKEIARRWGVLYTPTVIFLSDEIPEAGSDATVKDATVSVMPGAFGKGTVLDMFTWVVERGYEGDEHFQAYHARKIQERNSTD